MKKLFGSLLVLMILGVGSLVLKSSIDDSAQTNKVSDVGEASVGSVKLGLDFGESELETMVPVDDEGESVMSVLEKGVDNEGLELKLEHYDFGDLVVKIGDSENTKEKSWIYFVNGQAGNVAAGEMVVKAGDSISWKYIEPEF